MEKQVIHQGIASGFGALAGAFVAESIQHLLPWLMVSFAVIICDLVVGIRKSLIMGEEVRFSRAVRATLGKCVSYFAFVVMVCMIDVAAKSGQQLEKWMCLLICAVEGASILANILKPKGIDLNIGKVLALFVSKKTGIDKEEIEDLIKEEKQ
jgi:phage-related holin